MENELRPLEHNWEPFSPYAKKVESGEGYEDRGNVAFNAKLVKTTVEIKKIL